MVLYAPISLICYQSSYVGSQVSPLHQFSRIIFNHQRRGFRTAAKRLSHIPSLFLRHISIDDSESAKAALSGLARFVLGRLLSPI